MNELLENGPVVILTDLGSATLTVESVLDFLEDEPAYLRTVHWLKALSPRLWLLSGTSLLRMSCKQLWMPAVRGDLVVALRRGGAEEASETASENCYR